MEQLENVIGFVAINPERIDRFETRKEGSIDTSKRLAF